MALSDAEVCLLVDVLTCEVDWCVADRDPGPGVGVDRSHEGRVADCLALARRLAESMAGGDAPCRCAACCGRAPAGGGEWVRVPGLESVALCPACLAAGWKLLQVGFGRPGGADWWLLEPGERLDFGGRPADPEPPEQAPLEAALGPAGAAEWIRCHAAEGDAAA